MQQDSVIQKLIKKHARPLTKNRKSISFTEYGIFKLILEVLTVNTTDNTRSNLIKEVQLELGLLNIKDPENRKFVKHMHDKMLVSSHTIQNIDPTFVKNFKEMFTELIAEPVKPTIPKEEEFIPKEQNVTG